MGVSNSNALNSRSPDPALGRDLPERVEERTGLVEHVSAWKDRRNGEGVKADWQFTTADARVKLRKLYPTIDD